MHFFERCLMKTRCAAESQLNGLALSLEFVAYQGQQYIKYQVAASSRASEKFWNINQFGQLDQSSREHQVIHFSHAL
jgi:hypothetical protein